MPQNIYFFFEDKMGVVRAFGFELIRNFKFPTLKSFDLLITRQKIQKINLTKKIDKKKPIKAQQTKFNAPVIGHKLSIKFFSINSTNKMRNLLLLSI